LPYALVLAHDKELFCCVDLFKQQQNNILPCACLGNGKTTFGRAPFLADGKTIFGCVLFLADAKQYFEKKFKLHFEVAN
jgi:hypothetical protein